MEQNYTFLYALLSLGAVLFSLGVIGVSLRSREYALLSGVILMMLASVLTLVAYSGFHGSWSGQVFALVVVVVMAIHVVVNSAISGRVALQPNTSDATDTNEVASELRDSAEVEDVILCPMLRRLIVLTQDDQLSRATGKKHGQNVRLASKLVGWDIEVMTQNELDEQLDRSVEAFIRVPSIDEEMAESLVAQGFFSFYDLSVIEPVQLAELSGLTCEECDVIVEFAANESEE